MAYLEPQRGPVPYARPSGFSRDFWDACARGELIYQYFPASGRANFSPAPIDRVSLSDAYEWRRSSGRGSVYSYSEVHRPQTPDFETPYVVAIVELDEGYQMISNIVGCDSSDVVVGMRVEVVFQRIDENLTLPYFTPVQD